MLIEIDGAVRDFSIGMIACTMQVEMVSDEDLQCEILMSTIQFGSNIGFIKHRFRKSKSIDQFISTSKLITDWNDVFPNRFLPRNPNSRHKIELVGNRDLYFKSGNFMRVATMADWRSLR